MVNLQSASKQWDVIPTGAGHYEIVIANNGTILNNADCGTSHNTGLTCGSGSTLPASSGTSRPNPAKISSYLCFLSLPLLFVLSFLPWFEGGEATPSCVGVFSFTLIVGALLGPAGDALLDCTDSVGREEDTEAPE